MSRRNAVCMLCCTGVVRCEVKYGADRSSYVDSMEYHVIAPPSVAVDPMVVGVYIRDTVGVQCRLTSDLYEMARFNWSKDGQQITPNDGSLPHLPQHYK